MAALSERPLRVLHFVDSLRVGGKERQTVELLKGLCQMPHVKLMVVTMGEEQFYVPEIQRIGIPLRYLIRKFRWDPFLFIRLGAVLKEIKPHIVHTNSDMATFYAWPLTRFMGIKLVDGTIRNAFTGHGLRWQFQKFLLRLSDARVANSLAGLETRGFRLRGTGNYVIYNGFDMSRFDAARAQPGAEVLQDLDGKQAVVMVAEFSDYKDYATYVRAAQIVLGRRNDVVFVAVGGGKNLEKCRQLASSAGSGIRFLGERRDVEAIVGAMSIGVLCTYTEGISNSVMEYMAAGLPVIVTDGGGSREIVLDGETGFLIPGSNPERLAEKIVVLLDEPNRARRMGHAGKVRLTSLFSLDRLSANTLRMYQEVLAGNVEPNNVPEQRALCRGIASSQEFEFNNARHPNSSNRMPLKILVVTAMYPHPGQEGSGAFVMQQVEQLRAFGHEVDVLHFPGYRSKLEYLRAAREVRRRTRRGRYDVVHAHYGVTGIVAIFRRRTPLVVTLHGSDALLGWLGPMISRWVCRLADGTIVASRKIAARIPGEIIPCGVDLSRFEPKGREASRERLGLAPARRYVLFPFNPARRVKRFDLAAAAVDRLAAGGLNVELLTVSKVPNGEMPWYYSAADAMILCSDSEGSPTAVKEALACNLPVVSTDVGDVTEILEGIDGCAVRPQSAEALAEGLQRVLYPTSGLVFDGRQAMRRYCQEETVRKIVQVYYRTIERREPRAAAAAAHSAVAAVAKGEVRSEK